jgi:hypothetical protein
MKRGGIIPRHRTASPDEGSVSSSGEVTGDLLRNELYPEMEHERM